MKENREVTDTNVEDIKEDIIILEQLIIANENCIKNTKNKDNPFVAVWKKQNTSINNILSDYKRVLKENEKINSLIRKLKKDSKERQWIQTADDEYLAYTEKAMYADELLSFLRGEE